MKRLKYIFGERKNSARLAAVVAGFFVLLLASAAFGDVVDDSLPADAPQAVKASARQAIQSELAQEDVVKLTRAMLQNKFDDQQIQVAHALMIEAKNSGMPVQPLINKAFEGMAKGVDPLLIVGAMETVQSRNSSAYRNAAKLSGNQFQIANLGRALAAAQTAGFSKEDADKLTQMLRQRAQSMPPDEAYSLALECFYAARDVSRLGVSSQAVTNMLAGALSKGFNHQDMRAMRNAFMTQAQKSQPQNLARRYAAAIQEGKGFQEGSGGGEGSGGAGPGASGSGGSGSGSGGSGPGSGGSGSSGGNADGGSAGSGGSAESGGSGGSGESGGSGAGGSGPGSGSKK
jgi:hypothetical protein